MRFKHDQRRANLQLERQIAATGWYRLCRAFVRLGPGDVQGFRNKARLVWVGAQDPLILSPSRVIESYRKCLWDDPFLDPLHERLESCRRLPSRPTRAVSQARNFEVTEEVLDVWCQLCGSFVIVAGPPGWDKTISLSYYSRLV